MAVDLGIKRGRTAIARAGCPCGNPSGNSYGVASVALVMQLATLGLPQRLRAQAVTLHLCEECVRKIHTKAGRAVRKALATAVQAQLVDIRRQQKGRNAA